MTWKPIETAPKDGELVLIYKPSERLVGEYMLAAYWDDEQGGFVAAGTANKQGYFSRVLGRDQGYPTHWMELPDPPLPPPTIHERCPSHGDEQDERPISINQAMYDAGHKASDFS